MNEAAPSKVALYRSKSEQASLEMENLLKASLFSGAVDRAYYAAFHMTQALLATQDLEFSSHEAVIAAFGREYAKTKKLDPELHRILMDAFELRLTADYDVEVFVDEKEAITLIGRVRRFLKTVGELIRSTSQ